ncbi:hypothetical protein D3C87_2083940 [compost metagenome]
MFAATSKMVRKKPKRKKQKMKPGSGKIVSSGLKSATIGSMVTAVRRGVRRSVMRPAIGRARKVPTGALSSARPSTALST